MVDTLGQDKNKKFIHDFWDLVWSAIELSNDPSTILALAEVAAYLCHALEMEDAAIHAIAKEREELNRKAAQNRKERNQYQQTTYQDSYVFGDPNATVEEVILSALGVIQKSVEEAKRNNPDDIFMEKDGVPGSVVLGSEEEGDDEETTKDSRTASSPKTQSTTNRTVQQEEDEQADRDTDNEEEDTDEEREVRRKVCEIDHHDIDTDVLRERIAKRSMEAGRKRLRRQNHGKTSTKSSDIHMRSKVKNANKTCGKKEDVDDGKKDIEELESLIQTSEGAETPKQTNVLNFEEDPAAERSATDFDDSVDPVRVPLENELPLEGETPVAHFYRVLDEVLTKRRVDAMDSVLSRSGLAKSEYGEDEHKGTGTLKDRLQKLRAAIGADKHLTPPLDPETIHYRDNVVKVERFLRKNKKLVLALVVMVLYFVVIFFAFGCYGIYMFVFPPSPKMAYTTIDTSSSSTAKSTTSGADLHLPLLIHEDFRKHQKNNEYVIRVIREVVHVNEKGETIEMEEHDEL